MSKFDQTMRGWRRQLGWLVVMAAALVSLPAMAATVAGQVVLAVGEVVAQSPGAPARPLARRSEVLVGETLRTGANARAQIRFQDGAILSLREDSELRIDQYRFENNGGAGDAALMTLVKGGFRTITGAIGKADPAAYKVSTAVATIGIRGTFYEAHLGDGLGVAVWQGGVSLENDAGTLNLGQNANFNFGLVRSRRQAPQGLLTPPPGIDDAEVAPESEQASGEGESDSQGEGEAQAEGKAAPAAQAEGEVAGPDRQGGAGTQTPPDNTASSGAPASGAGSTSTTVAGTAEPVQPVLTGSDQFSQPHDPRLSTAEAQSLKSHLDQRYFGVTVIGSVDDFGASPTGGRTNGGGFGAADAGGMFFAGYPGDPGDEGFVSGSPEVIIRQNTAQAAYLGTNVWAGGTETDAAPVRALGIDWGVWEAGPATNCSTCSVSYYGDSTNPEQKVEVAAPVFWLTGQASDPTQLGGLTGNWQYTDVVMVNGGGSGGQIVGMSLGIDADFTTGQVSGYMGVSLGSNPGAGPTVTESFSTTFDSSSRINGNFINLEFDPAQTFYQQSNGPSVAAEGGAGGFFVTRNGDPAGAIAGAFDFRELNSTTPGHVEGIFVIQGSQGPAGF